MCEAYKGELSYYDEDILYMKRFIVRRNSEHLIDRIAFNALTTWNDPSLWEVDAEAFRQDDGSFVTREIFSVREATRGNPCVIKFTTVKFGKEGEVYVEGSWSEQGEEYKFYGELVDLVKKTERTS